MFRFGRVPKVQNSSAIHSPEKTRAEEEEERAVSRGPEEEGGEAVKGDEVVVEVGKGEEGEKREPGESLAGEREHRVPNITAPRWVIKKNRF